jgi:hypothetical protein
MSWSGTPTKGTETVKMQLHFSQRRRHILAEWRQMKNDAESYNENGDPENPVECDFNFNLNLEEEATPSTHPDLESDPDEEDEPL